MVAKLKKEDRLNLTLMTHDHDRETCQLIPNMANASSIRALPIWQRVYCSQIIKKDRLNLTLMTHDREPCQLVPNMANDSSIRASPHWQRVYGSQIKKKRQTKPNPNDS